MDQPLTLERIITFLVDAPLFEALDASELSNVVRVMQVQRLRDGQAVFHEGDTGDGWYVLFDGTVEVTRRTPFGAPRSITVLQPPSCFGEMAVLDGSARSATVRARGEVVVFKFPRDPFQELLDAGNLGAYKLVLAMARVLCERQRALTEQMHDLLEEREGARYARVMHRIGPLLDAYSVSE